MPFTPFTKEKFLLRSKDRDGTILESRTRLFERTYSARRNLRPLATALKDRGSWREGWVGRLNVILLDAQEVLEAAQALARDGIFCYDLDPKAPAGISSSNRRETACPCDSSMP